MTEFVKANYLEISGTQIAVKFGVSKTVIYSILRKNNLTVPRSVWHQWRADRLKRPITPEEIQFIHDNIRSKSIKSMARDLKRTSILISETAKELGYADLIIQNAKESRIQKGSVPANKGKKMDAKTREKVKHTWYKKGNVPTNTLYDGAITIRNESQNKTNPKMYKYIRLSAGEWEPLHRHIWEKVHGPIPEGFNIVFKDGDSFNCDIDNLEIIDNAENMQRNSIHNYPEELKETMKLIKKINQKIKKNEQHN